MTRSFYIYLLQDTDDTEPGKPVAAFTVKHELVTWLHHSRPLWGHLKLYRMKDNPHWSPAFRRRYEGPTVTELSIPELMGEDKT
jgi:hypothetical protein